MRIQTRSSSKHITFAAHAPHAISAESAARSTQISARARIASRSGVGVGVGTASTTAKRLFDDGAPRMSQLKVLVDHAARRHCAGCRLRSKPRHASLTLARLLRFDRDLDGDTATVCADVAVQTAVATEHHSAVSACPGPDRRSRDASMREKFPSPPSVSLYSDANTDGLGRFRLHAQLMYMHVYVSCCASLSQ